ncbi:hypothetical protein B0T26DRAFT_659997 [Lasiosphaeria miniovina]|uniref:Glycosyltransferase family 31 protein n=1 Tax=Lasiosphaeria miniovina TaxID=1954250 RepID=A0AA40DI78_9PEZI|nr:uncharacterized protein B0T26DRAFT_659997 [Lasiosphaeria miniovina]KAK0701752.1 hypothetical protein B0T26DRAFT_659997 [Lasiosphaeria miniovina]
MVPPSSSSSNVKTLPPPSLTEAGVPLFNPNVDFERVRTKSPDTPRRGVDKAVLTLSTPGGQGAEAVDVSALLFGVASNYDRLMYGDQALMHDWARWLTDGRGKSNGAGLVVVLQMAPSAKQVSTIRDELQRLGIDAAVASAADRPDETAYQQVVTRLLRGRFRGLRDLQRQQYFGIIEEDVFFPSMARLLEKLAPFSPDKEYYIGLPSEQSDWVVYNGTALTYGGGAVFTTAPLLDKVGAECLQEPASTGGAGSSQVFDVLLHDCIAKHIGASMHVLPSLYNPVAPPPPTADVGGYGSGMRPLTLHHYRNWHRFEAGKGHRVTSACGEACFLQRFLFADGWVLVNGYTLTHYPEGVEAAAADAPRLDDRLVIEEAAALDLATPPRDAKTLTSPGRTKKTWRLLDSRTRDNGDVWQAYVNRKGDDNSGSEIDDRLASDIRHSDEERSDVDSVILLIWDAPVAPARTKAKALA